MINDIIKQKKILKTLALANPDFDGYFKEISDVIDSKADLPADLTANVFKLLQSDPDMAAAVNALSENSGGNYTFVVPELLGAGTLVFALFLLRSHIKIKRDSSGKLEFLFEHKPSDNELLSQVIASLKGLISRS
jgi:hypothetical protein